MKPTTAVTDTSSPYAVRRESTARRMMLSPDRSWVSGLGWGLPRRVPSPAARITTCLATWFSLDWHAAADESTHYLPLG